MIRLQYVWIRNYESLRTIVAHQHSCCELIYYLKGDGDGAIGNKPYHYEPSTFVFVNPNVTHRETHAHQTSMISIGFTTDSPLPDNCFYKDASSKIFNFVQTIRHEFKKKDAFHQEYIESLLAIVLLEIQRKNLEEVKSFASPKDGNIDYAISYVNEYYMADINLSDLAHSTGYCDDHFRILFKKKTGMAPKEYILHVRLCAAQKMLEENELSLTDIATKCGFEYYSRFSLFFKTKTGLAPSEYRARFLQKNE
ncbi:MAG: helix-turn-helix domain-containing protein [Clostridia bacterium]|nr:helix-turn-helix domain-containing protein [Clostridia bacterium]